MIEIEGIRYRDLEEEERSVPSFSSALPLIDLSQSDLATFDFLSFRFETLLEGSLNVNGLCLKEQKDTERLFYLNLSVFSFCELGIVLYLQEGKDFFSFKKEISSLLSPLKSDKEDEEEGAEKLKRALSLLVDKNVCYLLLDGRNSLNEKHWKDIRKVVLLSPFVCVAFPFEEKKEEKPKEEKPLPSKKEKKIAKPSSFFSFIKKEGSSLLFLSIFALLFGLGFCCGVSFCNEGSVLYGILSIIVGLLCAFFFLEVLSLLGPSLARLETSGSDFALGGGSMALSTVLGGMLGVLIYWIMVRNAFLMEADSWSPLALLLASVLIFVLALSCFLAKPIGKAFDFVKKRLGLRL